MEPARKPQKAAPALPVTAPARKPAPAPPSRIAALQGQVGASALQAVLAQQAPRAPHAMPNAQGGSAGSAARPAAAAARGQARAERKPGDGKDATKASATDGARQPSPVEGEGDKGAEPKVREAAPVAINLHMPEPPSKPSVATRGRIAGVKSRAGSTTKAQGALPGAGKLVGDAQKAVTPPEAERIAQERAQLIATVQAAPSPEIAKLGERIREAIRNRRPPDEDALVKAEPAKEASEAGGQLNASVQGESRKVQDNYGPIEGPPQPAAATPGAPLPPQPAAAQTPALNAKAAVPDAVQAQSVSLDKDAAATRRQADDAGMNKPAAALVQSGPIAEARAAQGELDQVAQESPAEVLAKQKEALGRADADMGALQMEALQKLDASRAGTVAKTTNRQQGMVGTEGDMRAKAGADAKAVFDQAQTDVRALLKPLVPTAMDKWEAAKTTLTTQFKNDLKIVKDRVDERHSGVGGAIVGVWDAVTGLPDWATEAYDKAENNFAEGVIAKLTEISIEVNSVIQACEAIIKAARERIAGIFASLPESLRGWATQEQAKFETGLDKLGQEAVATRDGFNKDLTERASQAVDEVRAEIAELRKKAGGLVGRIVAAVQRFVDDPVKFIIEGLLEILGISPAAFWAVVARIKKVVKNIVDDPIGFANNLLKGIGQGFGQFFDNFAGHMIRGFLSWLLGDLKDVQIPKEISVKSIITFFLQLMGITWPNIRKILAKKIGEKNVALIEKVYSLITFLIDQGPQGIYEMVKEKLDPQSIVDQVVQMAVEYMVTAIAKQVAARLLLLFNPAGAIAQAIEAIYRVLKWVFQNAARIFTLIETIVNGLADIIAGNVGGFAKAVERGLAMLIAPVLGFIADYFSLGDLPQTVAKQIKSFREWILAKIEAGFDWLIAKGKALLAALGIGGKDKKKEKDSPNAYDGQIGSVVHWATEEESHELWIAETGGVVEIMMASARKEPVRAKLSEYETQVGKIKGSDAKNRRARADAAIKEARKLLALTLAAAKETKAALADPDVKSDKAKKADDKTEGWEDLLWPELQTIQIALRLIKLPGTKVSGGGAKASTSTAEPLSSKGIPGSRPKGKLRGWEHVLTLEGGSAYWVAAHLVSEKLHGPGDPWNTTPMRKVDNKDMEIKIEADAKTRIGEDEVLYYSASVEYHSGEEKILEDFPASIAIEWGSMRYDKGIWERGEPFGTYSRTLDRPPLEPSFVADINEIRRTGLMKRGVPVRFAMAIDTERKKGEFASQADLESRMTAHYAAPSNKTDLKLQEGLGIIATLISQGKLQIGK